MFVEEGGASSQDDLRYALPMSARDGHSADSNPTRTPIPWWADASGWALALLGILVVVWIRGRLPRPAAFISGMALGYVTSFVLKAVTMEERKPIWGYGVRMPNLHYLILWVCVFGTFFVNLMD